MSNTLSVCSAFTDTELTKSLNGAMIFKLQKRSSNQISIRVFIHILLVISHKYRSLAMLEEPVFLSYFSKIDQWERI